MSLGGKVDDSVFDTILHWQASASIRRGNESVLKPCRRPQIVGRLLRLLGPIRGERLLDRNPSGFDCNE
jgi:hypothetical protein